MLRKCILVLCGLSLALAATGIASATSYTISDLGIAASGTTNTIYASIPLSVNDSGQVVGYIAASTSTNASERRAAYYSGGTWYDIGDSLAPGNGITAGSGKPSMATCINDNGLVSGWYAPSGIVNGVSYTYQIGGSFNYPASNSGVLNNANYGAIHSINGGTFNGNGAWQKWACGSGLNDSGTLLGSYNDGTNEWGYTFNGSTSTQVPIPAGYQFGVVGANNDVAINASGVIVCVANIDSSGIPGFSGTGYYITTDGVWHTATGITTPTNIAGNYIIGSNAATPFTGSTAEIGIAGGSTNGQASSNPKAMIISGDLWSLPTGVSTNGVAVGVSDTQSTPAASSVQVTIDSTQRAFIYSSSGGSTALLSSEVTGSDPFSSLQAATAISENGSYIVGYGPVNGVMHGFLLTAVVPEPSTLLLAATALAGLLAYAWRKRK